MYKIRQEKLRKEIANRKLDALLVTCMPNVFYLTGFTGSTAAVIVTADSSHILVDPRYSIQARSECAGTEVRDYSAKATIAAAAELANELKPAALGFEAENLTVSVHRNLTRALTGSALRSTKGLVERLRSVKDARELELTRRAVQITDRTFDTVVKVIKPGMTEKEIALLIDTTMRKLGADKESFETIAAAGPNSACPHHSPTDAVLQNGHLLKVDYGARLANYNSDITRTVCFGTPDAKQREVYQVVLDAQLAAIAAIKPGIAGREIDAVARDYIASKGYGDNFGHGLGHALGIEVHDGPGFSKTSDVILEPGMVMTVEPGVYIEGWGGVRIEDDVVVTETGAEILTKATKELLAL